jgi:MFS family permease
VSTAGRTSAGLRGGVWRNSAFLRIWGAQAVSEVGDWAARLAMSILVFRATGSALQSALVFSVSLLPALCMDLFGARAVASIIGTLYTGAALGNLLGPVIAGAVFDRVGSYGPVIWACIGLSALATLASARLMGAQPVAKAPG